MTSVHAVAGTRVRRRPPVGARRVGYVVALVLNLALLYAVNGIGWERLSFLTEDTERVVGLVNLSLVAAVLANLVYVAHDPPRLKAMGDALTTGISAVALVRIWQVFPFDVDDSSPWELVVRAFLVLALVGCLVAIVTGLLALARGKLDLVD